MWVSWQRTGLCVIALGMLGCGEVVTRTYVGSAEALARDHLDVLRQPPVEACTRSDECTAPMRCVDETCIDPHARPVASARVVAYTHHGVLHTDVDSPTDYWLRRELHAISLDPTDDVTVRVAFQPGDVVPGEGIVGLRRATPSLVAGIVMIAAAVTFTLIGAAVLSGGLGSCESGQDCSVTVAGGVLLVGAPFNLLVGAGLLVHGLVPHAVVEPTRVGFAF